MQNRSSMPVHFLFTSLVIFILHIPFSIARTKPLTGSSNPGNPPLVSGSAASIVGLPPFNAKPELGALYDSLCLASAGLARQVFNYAMLGYDVLKKAGKVANEQVISIVDFSKPSGEKRLYVIDLARMKLLFKTYVAHGVNSGQAFARQFSNIPSSNRSSLGFYTTAATYQGKHGQSLQLVGLEKGINDQALKRSIVMHGASYVNESLVRTKGFIGRSHGCPAVPENLSSPIIEKIKNGSLLLIYAPDPAYARKSSLIKQSLNSAAG